MNISRIYCFPNKEASTSPQHHFANLLGQEEATLQLLYFNVQEEWLIKVKFFYRITPRRFHSYYMAHTLRDAIIETNSTILSNKCMQQIALEQRKS